MYHLTIIFVQGAIVAHALPYLESPLVPQDWSEQSLATGGSFKPSVEGCDGRLKGVIGELILDFNSKLDLLAFLRDSPKTSKPPKG